MVDRIEQLERLVRLRDQGGLTDEEFNIEKARLLSDGILNQATQSAEVPEKPTRLANKKIAIPIAAISTAILGGIAFGTYAISELPNQSKKENEVKKIQESDLKNNADLLTERRISSYIRFDNIANCEPDPDFSTFLDDMRSLEPSKVEKPLKFGTNGPILRVNVQNAFGADAAGAIIASASVEGVFHDLKVHEIRTTRFPGSEVESLQLRFSESPERVRKKLSEFDLQLPDIGEVKIVELDEGHRLVAAIERVSNGASLLCSRI